MSRGRRFRRLWLAAPLAGLASACAPPPSVQAPSPDGGVTAAGPSLGAGAFHTCSIFSAGAVRCWGDNGLGQLGRAAGEDPLADYSVDLGKGQRATAVYAGAHGTCVILAGGAVKCWGANSFGQLGLGDTVTRGDGTGAMGDALPALDLGVGRRAVGLALGGSATCALLADGAVKCWGDAYQGATGHGDIWTRGDRPGTMGDNLPTVDLGSRDGVAFRVTQVAAFDYHSFCAILDVDETGPDSSGLKCWGSNDYCELGLGTHDGGRGAEAGMMGNALEWVDLGVTAAGAKRKAIALGGGYQSTCVLGDDGVVSCWGMNGSGQLGNGEVGAARSCSPHEVGDANVVLGTGPAVAVGARGLEDGSGAHACALLATGAVSCWGGNRAGQLGTGDTTPRLRPSPALVFPDDFAPNRIVLGDEHTCVISADDRVKCWGSNRHGQLGPEAAGERLAPGPDLRSGSRRVLALAAGDDHTCAILDGGALKCWGHNGSGQLGLGDLGGRGDKPSQMGANLPEVDVSGSAVAVATGAAHTCAITGVGAVRCWGAGDAGQLGLGTEIGGLVPAVTPVVLPGAATAVAAGADYSCALLAGGQVICWGAGGRGQLGTGDLLGRAAPAGTVAVSGRVTQLAAGARHVCALLDSRKLACWGANDRGQLGVGDTADRSRPAVIETGSGEVRAVAAGGDTTCVLVDGGAVRCWGANDHGQLGAGDAAPRALPAAAVIALGSGRSASAVSVGGGFVCALLDTSQAKCWGDNRALQLGAPITGPAYGDDPNETGDFLAEVVNGGGRSLGSIAAGRAHACAVLDTGDVRCWGDNNRGQLGAGDSDMHSALLHPTAVVVLD